MLLAHTWESGVTGGRNTLTENSASVRNHAHYSGSKTMVLSEKSRELEGLQHNTMYINLKYMLTQNDTTYFTGIHAYFLTYSMHFRVGEYRRVMRVRMGEGENTQRKGHTKPDGEH